MDLDITVIVPTIPSRAETYLRDAMHTVSQQDLLPSSVILQLDADGRGPAWSRNEALNAVCTSWVAFLDDDDLMGHQHLRVLAEAQQETGADVLWPWFWVLGGTDPFPQHFGKQWDPDNPHIFPITTLVRTSWLEEVGGFREAGPQPDPNDSGRTVAGEDWDLWLRLSAAGAKFLHVPERTWTWRHHTNNTSGLPSRR